MANGQLATALRTARLADIGHLSRRVLGLPYMSREDFLPTLSYEAAARLSGLSRRARGDGPAPVIVLGVMPRCGTNFLHDLLALHPDVYPDPGTLYEFPLLSVTGAARALRDEFVLRFPRNAENVHELDLLAMLAGAWLGELRREAGSAPILLKSPHVNGVGLAPHIFSGARIILCLRDGRDVVDSTLKSFSRFSLGRKTFGQLSREWRLGAEAIASFRPGGENAHPDVIVVRYEDLISDLKANVSVILQHAGLAADRYDLDAAATLPVRGSSRSSAVGDDRWKPEARTADFKPLRRWENWSQARKDQFIRIAGPSLSAAGYEH